MGGEGEGVARVEDVPCFSVDLTAYLEESGHAGGSLILGWGLLAVQSACQIESPSTLFGCCSVRCGYGLPFARLECSRVG